MLTKTESVYTALKQQVLSGQLAPGERLVIRRLAETFQTSDIPVREALKMLERDGLIQFVPYEGARVFQMSPQEIREAMLIRSRLEGLATGLATEAVTYAAMRQLRVMVAEMDRCIADGELERYGALNREFHQAIYDLAPYPRLRNLIQDSWNLSSQMRAVFLLSPERAALSNAEHCEILDALEAGDAERAEILGRQHKMRSAEALLRHVEASEVVPVGNQDRSNQGGR